MGLPLTDEEIGIFCDLADEGALGTMPVADGKRKGSSGWYTGEEIAATVRRLRERIADLERRLNKRTRAEITVVGELAHIRIEEGE